MRGIRAKIGSFLDVWRESPGHAASANEHGRLGRRLRTPGSDAR